MSTVNKVKPGKFEKQTSEEFIIAADFSKNMDLTTEDLNLEKCVVSALKVDGKTNATDIVTDQSTIAKGIGVQKGWLKCLIKAGVEADQPYKITFYGETDTTPPEKWEKDVIMKIKEV